MRDRQSSTRLPAKPGRSCYIFRFRRAQGGDAVRGQVALIVEGSGIAEIARELQFDWEAEAFAVMEKAL